jgi:hydrogenase nickel incorporation protein HypA/HybF
MESILRVVRESAVTEGISKVASVGIVVGRRSGALPAALRLAFEVLSRSDDAGLFSGAVLKIEERPVRACCRRCGSEYGEGGNGSDGGDRSAAEAPADTAAWAFVCPTCGAPAPEYLSGTELFIDHYEGE